MAKTSKNNPKTVLVTAQIPEEGIALLEKARHRVRFLGGKVSPKRSVLLQNARGVDAILCLLSDKIDREFFEHCGPQLRAVANFAVGFDNIDLSEASKRGVAVSNTPGVLTRATAELAWALIFAAARHIPRMDRFVRAGKFVGWEPSGFLGIELKGKTLGIVGAGRIGVETAKIGAALGMKILYFSRDKKYQLEKEISAKKHHLKDLLKKSDIVSLHVALTSQTHKMIAAQELKLMKPNAILINTARGPVVDESALYQALKKKQIFAAGLDVYEKEPQVLKGLLSLENVVLAPHVGSATFETRRKMSIIAAENILKALQGQVPRHCLNPEFLKNHV